jgi:hypothetical protein
MSRFLKTVTPLASGTRGSLVKIQEKALDVAHHLLDAAVHGAGWSAVRLAAAYRVVSAFSVYTKQKLQNHRRQLNQARPNAPTPMTTTADSWRTRAPISEHIPQADMMQTAQLKTPLEMLPPQIPKVAGVYFTHEHGDEPELKTHRDAPVTAPLSSDSQHAHNDEPSPSRRPIPPKEPQQHRWPTSWVFSLALVLGLLVGAAFMATAGWLWLRMPYATEGADFNGDGIIDSTRTISASGQTLRIEIDRNMDGKIDRIQTTNLRGQIESSLSDDDFDGVFESQAWFSNGQLESSQTDADGDGFAEIRSYYPYGIKATTRHIDPQTHRDVRIEHFKLGVLTFAIEDIDGEGKINHRIDYSPTGQVLRTSKLKQQP